ncbi:MAG: hypothetical protein WBF76_08850, partial [Pseudonocardiaceae bacterium]
MLGRGGDGSVAREFAGQVVGAEQRGVGDGDPDINSATAPAAPANTSAAGSPGDGRTLDVVTPAGRAAVTGAARSAVGTEWLLGGAFVGGVGVLAPSGLGNPGAPQAAASWALGCLRPGKWGRGHPRPVLSNRTAGPRLP